MIVNVVGADDPRLEDYRRLKDQRDEGPIIAEGIEVVRALLRSAYPLRSVLVTPERLAIMESELADLPVPVYVAPRAVLISVVGFDLHRGAVAAADRLPLRSVDAVTGEDARLLLVLEGVNDHENLGALFRNAAAFGVDAVILDRRTADPLYRRSVRVSMGHVLHVPFTRTDVPAGLTLLRERGFAVLGLTPATDAESIGDVDVDGPIALVLGAEGPGLTTGALAATRQVRIPMASGVDSLNVATAAAVALYEMAARRVSSMTARRSGPQGSGKMIGSSTPAST